MENIPLLGRGAGTNLGELEDSLLLVPQLSLPQSLLQLVLFLPPFCLSLSKEVLDLLIDSLIIEFLYVELVTGPTLPKID